ncbi:hypothetical protein BC833DRAFT_380534 [Globomyces pollinis-pini]|nr:hypothetical protein BC833DRAFT_380534 [Globomyces pollinis-pini]
MGETHTSWSVLYCKAIYKQRKVKPWLDGTIKISKNKITLYNCDDQIIDSCFNASVIPLLCEDYTLNFDYHLCTLESPCQDQYDDITQPKSIPNQIIKSKSIPMNPKSNSIVKKSQPKHKMNNIVCGNQKLVNENNDSKTTIKSITRSKDELIQLFSISKSDKNIKSTLPKNNLIHLFNSNQSTMKIIDCVDLVSEDIISKPIHVHSNSNTSIINNPNSSNINNANSSIINNSNTSITNNNMEEKRNSFNTKTLNKTANVCNDDKSDGGILAPKATNKTKLKVGLKKHGDPKINVNDSSPQLINSSKENLDTGPKRIKLSTTFQNLKQPLIDKHFKCKENSSILSSTVVPSIRKNHHLKDTQLQPSSSNNQLGLIFEMPVLPNAKLTRQSIIPNRFKSIYTYQETLKQSIIESMNIDLQQLYIQFYKHLNAGVNTDTKFRYKSISFYQDLTMTSFDGGDSKPFIFNSTLKARKDHNIIPNIPKMIFGYCLIP